MTCFDTCEFTFQDNVSPFLLSSIITIAFAKIVNVAVTATRSWPTCPHQIPPHCLPLSLLSTSPLPAHSTSLRCQLLSALHTPLLLSIVPSVAPPPCHYRVPTTPTPLPSFPHRFPDYNISAPLFPCLCVMSGIVHIKASLLLLWRAPLYLSLQLLSLLTPIRLTHSPTFQCDHFPSVQHNQGCCSYYRSPPFSLLPPSYLGLALHGRIVICTLSWSQNHHLCSILFHPFTIY